MVLLQNKLNLRVSQKQILTPGLVQMVSVLALNKLELKEMINTEMVENPVLEELDSSVPLLDEVAGQWFALLPVAVEMRGSDWRPYVMGFIFFRLFDILKPWPISAVEKLPGGFGIMMDDVLAGLIAAALLYGTLAIGLV